MGLPYLLGDSDPRDPVNGWAKTWEYLAALGENIEYYPTGTGGVMKELGEGTRDIVATTTGWDINPRALGIVPSGGQGAEARGLPLGHRRPLRRDSEGRFRREGGRADRRSSTTSCSRSSRPSPTTPAISIPVRRSRTSRSTWRRRKARTRSRSSAVRNMPTGSPNNPLEVPLEPKQLVEAFRIWDEKIGAKKG